MLLHTKVEEEEFPGSISMGIRAGARQDRPSAGVHVTARQFLNIDTTQSELEIALDDGSLPPGGGISGTCARDDLLAIAGTRGSGMFVAPQQLGDSQIMGQLIVTVVNA